MNNHDTFLGRLRASEGVKARVAQWLIGKGHPVEQFPGREAPTADQHKEYADFGDLYMLQRVEVKQRRNENFTSREDWGFPNFFVAARAAHDRAFPKPYMYVVVNQAETHAGIVYSSSFDKWKVQEVTDSEYGHKYEVYAAPLDCVKFIAMEKGGK